MNDKTRFLMAILIAVSLFLAVLVVSIYGNLKKTELRFNERKATLIKENLDLKDANKTLENTLNQKKEAFTLLEQERKTIEEKLAGFEQEKEAIKKDYENELLSLKKENASLTSKLEELEKKTLAEHIQEAIKKEGNETLKKFLAKVVYNIEIIKKGGNIELEPIVVTESGEQKEEAVTEESQTGSRKKPSPQYQGRKGKVISVDQKYSLVVFDIGRKDGVEKGKQCAILKDDKEIAQAEVISTRYNVSAAFVYETAYGHNIRDIKEGDGVVIMEGEK